MLSVVLGEEHMTVQEIQFLARFVEESDAIEGIRNIPGAVAKQLDDENNRERIGHAGALLRLNDYATVVRTELNEAIVKEVQRLITEEQHLKGEHKLPAEQCGHWRMGNVFIRKVVDGMTVGMWSIGSEPQNIPSDMASWISDVISWQHQQNNQPKWTKILNIARFHWRYERIHPFADGNGRSGRAIAYYMYKWAGMQPFVFTNCDKNETYYPCFMENAPDGMERYFLNRS